MGAPKRKLPAALARNIWKPGQSGNPSGNSGLYGETIRLARRAAPEAMRRLIELMASEDERVASVACNAVLERAFGKPREYDPKEEEADAPRFDFRRLSREERDALEAFLRVRAERRARELEDKRGKVIDEEASNTNRLVAGRPANAPIP